ncbi:MAG: type II secretion system protein J [Planctomycetaceae bacterium]
MMLKRTRRTSGEWTTVRRGGFTLVEMLVSVALVVLMMTLFASIFQLATGAMSTQKGLAENDQRSRLVLNALRNDLSRRTMKQVLPFAAAEDVTQPGAQMALRQGYFYVREGNPDDPTDDILQLTVATNPGEEPFYGLWARRLNASGQVEALLLPDANGNLGDQATGFWRNQPEFDDGAADLNFAASSPRAEVSYFLRNGSLYRRVLLIRQPSSPSGATSGQPQEGEQTLNLGLFQATGWGNGPTSQKFANFYACADFSAYLETSSNLLKFHGASSLDNAGSWLSVSLGHPKYRFGHNVLNGMPRESSALPNGFYFGRFTHEETSAYSYGDPSKGFGYPGRMTSDSPNPYDFATALTYNPDAGTIVEYAGGLRAGEDLLMTNVHRFDIRLWDPGLHPGPDLAPGRQGIDDDGNGVTDFLPDGQIDPGELGYPGSDDGGFIDLGHNGARGFYRAPLPQFLHPYCADGAFRFDTWHPQVKFSANDRPSRPPFRAALPGRDGLPGDPQFDDDQNGTVDDVNELGWPGTDDIALPLKAIQIRITFFENSTRQMRDVTLLFPLQTGLQ